MPAWLLMALKLIAAGLGGGAAFEAGQQLVGQPPGGGFSFPNIGFDGFGDILGGERKKRRRRRRALTHQDKDDIAFLAATVGEPTARKFALILASHGGHR